MKMRVLASVLLSLLLIGCTPLPPATNPGTTTPPATVAVATTPPATKPPATKPAVTSLPSSAKLADATVTLLNSADVGTGTYKADHENEFIMFIPNDDIPAIIRTARVDYGVRDSWNDFVDAFSTTSKSIYRDCGYSYVMVNPYNRDDILLGCLDGLVVFDAVRGY